MSKEITLHTVLHADLHTLNTSSILGTTYVPQVPPEVIFMADSGLNSDFWVWYGEGRGRNIRRGEGKRREGRRIEGRGREGKERKGRGGEECGGEEREGKGKRGEERGKEGMGGEGRGGKAASHENLTSLD